MVSEFDALTTETGQDLERNRFQPSPPKGLGVGPHTLVKTSSPVKTSKEPD